MNLKNKYSFYKKIALVMSFIMVFEVTAPSIAYALTSGPSQPEIQAFEPFGTSQMVDLFSGDFTYNIPLFELPGPNGGYPFNLAYHSGIGMDQEASWVGLGWSLNPGAINRNMRGIPDDFNGDEIDRKLHIKKNWTAGVSTGINVPGEIFGFDTEKAEGISLSGNFSSRYYYNSYKGVGQSVAAGINFKNTSNDGFTTGIGLNVALDSQDGASITPSLSLSKRFEESQDANGGALKSGVAFTYNTKRGLENMTLSMSSHSASISFANNSYTPTIGMAMKGFNASFNMAVGFDGFALESRVSIGGFYAEQSLKNENLKNKSFGYLYLENAKNEKDDEDNYIGLLDFNREKDGTVYPTTPNLAIPSLTYDVYSIQGHGIGGVFRPYRNDIGAVYDPFISSKLGGGNLGLEFSAGVSVGPEIQPAASGAVNFSKSISGKWMGNQFDGSYDFNSGEPNSLYESVYWKRPGELTSRNLDEIESKIGGFKPVLARMMGEDDEVPSNIESIEAAEKVGKKLKPKLSNNFRSAKESAIIADNDDRKNYNRQPRNVSIISLTNKELKGSNNQYNVLGEFSEALTRSDRNLLPEHHIGAITVFNTNGSRYNYGIPVYNSLQKEVIYNTGMGASSTSECLKTVPFPSNGILDYKTAYNGNTNQFLSSTSTPQYAYSYLITSIVGADYVDIGGDGPTDDDFGYWVKFEYEKYSNNYKWKAPFHGANFIEGNFSKKEDDMALYLYGEKETWYLSKVYTKSHVAVFVTSDERLDGRGVSKELQNVGDNLGDKSKKLIRIELYPKEHEGNPDFLIKKILFDYSYDLCPNVPNNANYVDSANPPPANSGKLTLNKVWFEHGSNKRGALNPYVFDYGDIQNEVNNPIYNTHNYDRWGNFKPENINNDCRNFEFPYVNQNDEDIDLYASAWNLKKIILPSGGSINIEYEADDYAFVQNKEAMQMYDIVKTGVINEGGGSYLYSNQGTLASATLADLHPEWQKIYFKLNNPIDDYTSGEQILKELNKYLDGRQLYYKTKLHLNGPSNNYIKEFIEGYADIDFDFEETYNSNKYYGIGVDETCKIGNQYEYAYVRVKTEHGMHPIVLAGLQYLKFIIPEKSNTVGDNTQMENYGVAQAIMSVFDMMGQVKELFSNFYKNRTKPQNAFCKKIDLDSSWIRLNNINGFKKGGGARVKSIKINDDWSNISNSDDGEYGHVYEYTTVDFFNGEEKLISSGVATYEPIFGGDETALRHAKKFPSKKLNTRNTENLIFEFPINESYYPAPSVGYSKVIVKSLNTHAMINDIGDYGYSSTGATINEFYTAKDFPVITGETSLEKSNKNNDSYKYINLQIPLPGLGNVSINKLAASQGYSIELNDMHGKQKKVSNHAINKNNQIEEAPYSYVEYNYFIDEIGRLNNVVPTLLDDIDPSDITKAWIEDRLVGVDFEMFADTRFHSSTATTGGLDFNLDITLLPPFFIPILLLLPWPNVNYDQSQVRLAVTNKVIQRSGILKETIVYNDGSTIKTENLVFDAETGRTLLSAVQNNYGNSVYSYSIPAHWKYDRMGSAYKNIGYKFKAKACEVAPLASRILTGHDDDKTVQLNVGQNPSIIEPLIEGDELLVFTPTGSVYKAFVLNKLLGNSVYIRLENANTLPDILDAVACIAPDCNLEWEIMVIRSGNRNHLEVDVANIVALKNPTTGREMFVCDIETVIESNPVGECGIFRPCFYEECEGFKEIYSTLGQNPMITVLGKTIRTHVEVGYPMGHQFNVVNLPFTSTSLPNFSNSDIYLNNVDYALIENNSIQFYNNSTNSTCKFEVLDLNGQLVDLETFTNADNQYMAEYRVDISTNQPSFSYPNGSYTNYKVQKRFASQCYNYYQTADIGQFNSVQDAKDFIDGINNIYQHTFNNPVFMEGGDPNFISSFIHSGGSNTQNYKVQSAITYDCFNNFPPYGSGYRITESSDPTPIFYVTAYRFYSSNKDYNYADYAYIYISPNEDCFTSYTRLYSDTCSTPIFDSIFVTDTLYRLDSILHVSIATYKDTWQNNLSDILFGAATSTNVGVLNNLCKFQNGLRGNWRLHENYAYLGDRKGIDENIEFGYNTSSQDDMESSNDGIFKFIMFDWKLSPYSNGCEPGWVRLNEVTKYNPFSFEVESKDALDNYSAALYGYKGSLPIAISANSQYDEIGFENFEEYSETNYNQFNLVPNNLMFNNQYIDNTPQFRTLQIWGDMDRQKFHVGNNVHIPLGVTGEVIVESLVGPHGTVPCYCVESTHLPNGSTFTILGTHTWTWNEHHFRTYILNSIPCSNSTTYPMWTGKFVYQLPPLPPHSLNNVSYSKQKAHTGNASLKISQGTVVFPQEKLSLIPNKKYLLSLWVNATNSNNVVKVKKGTSLLGVASSKGKPINGWQKQELVFSILDNNSPISIEISASSSNTVYIDDVRIHPFEATIQTNVYNPFDYRIQATLDDNNFATLYYYDDAGNLYLVKKETEKGIRTIQESRSHLKPRIN